MDWRALPVEVERNEHLHIVVGGRLVGESELGVGIGINANVEGKCINTGSFGTLHVIVVVCRAGATSNDSNLPDRVSREPQEVFVKFPP